MKVNSRPYDALLEDPAGSIREARFTRRSQPGGVSLQGANFGPCPVRGTLLSVSGPVAPVVAP
jgi:hypothetical protein